MISGIVVENPFLKASGRAKRHPEWVPDMVTTSEYLVCALRSWHTLDNPKPAYELRDFESAWTSDALVVRARADWPHEPDDVPTPTPRRDRPPKSATLALGRPTGAVGERLPKRP
jgi:hypothetical protein